MLSGAQQASLGWCGWAGGLSTVVLRTSSQSLTQILGLDSRVFHVLGPGTVEVQISVRSDR